MCLDIVSVDLSSPTKAAIEESTQKDDQEPGAGHSTGNAASEGRLPVADEATDRTDSSHSHCIITAGNGLYLEKLVIDEDAASVEGPPTPDNEDSGRVSMPATKRQRVSTSSPSALAASFARALFLL